MRGSWKCVTLMPISLSSSCAFLDELLEAMPLVEELLGVVCNRWMHLTWMVWERRQAQIQATLWVTYEDAM